MKKAQNSIETLEKASTPE